MGMRRNIKLLPKPEDFNVPVPGPGGYIPYDEKGAINGVAPLDADGLVPLAHSRVVKTSSRTTGADVLVTSPTGQAINFDSNPYLVDTPEVDWIGGGAVTITQPGLYRFDVFLIVSEGGGAASSVEAVIESAFVPGPYIPVQTTLHSISSNGIGTRGLSIVLRDPTDFRFTVKAISGSGVTIKAGSFAVITRIGD